MRPTHRVVSAVLGTTGLLVASSGVAVAVDGSGRFPIHAQPWTSSVCGFEVHATFPTDREFETDVYDASGTLVRSTVTGALFINLTRVDTGQSIERNLSGKGVYDYHRDGSFTLTSDGHLLYGLHPGDSPDVPGLYVTSGRTIIDFTAAGHRTVRQAAGQSENVCMTLS